MRRKNCWEVKACGRFPGGDRGAELGPCPAATCVPATGINGGLCGGRSCWAIADTLCAGRGAAKMRHCQAFYAQVRAEEGRGYQETLAIRGELAGYRLF